MTLIIIIDKLLYLHEIPGMPEGSHINMELVYVFVKK